MALGRLPKRSGFGWIAVAAVSVLVLAGCGGSESNSSQPSSPTGAVIRLYGFEPATALLPGMESDQGGQQILGNIFDPLTNYTPDGKLIMDAAESVTSADNRVWTIKVRQGWTFSNGETMNAKNFVDAWNYVADSQNHQANTYTVSHIIGYSPTLKGPLSGLKLVDNHTIEVTLKSPLYDFPDRLSDVSMYPLPESAFKDMDAYGKHPVGNGPYMLDKWLKGVSFVLKKNPNYKGPFKPKNEGLDFQVYNTTNAAYADYLAGNLDVLVPGNNKLAEVKKDSDGRLIVRPSNTIAFFAIPKTLSGFGYDKAGILRRRAVSMAINREEIIKTLFHDYYFSATSFLPSAIFPKLQNVEGSDNAKLDVEKAKKLWAEAQAIEPLPANLKVQFYYNADGGHKQWVDAVSNMLRNNLGLETEPHPIATFTEFVPLMNTAVGFIRGGWIGNMIPSGTIDQVFLPAGSSNYGKFDNAKFNKLYESALVETNVNKRTEILRETISILMQDLPLVPLWYYGAVTMYSTKVKNVQVDATGAPVLWSIEKTG